MLLTLLLAVCVSSHTLSLLSSANNVSVAGVAFFWSRAKFLPRPQADKEFRWDYDYVEIGEPQDIGYSMLDMYDEFHPLSDSDDWASGSSSSYSTGGRSPSGSRSPVDDLNSNWDGDTVGSDNEQGR
jgi:hypothetical protein